MMFVESVFPGCVSLLFCRAGAAGFSLLKAAILTSFLGWGLGKGAVLCACVFGASICLATTSLPVLYKLVSSVSVCPTTFSCSLFCVGENSVTFCRSSNLKMSSENVFSSFSLKLSWNLLQRSQPGSRLVLPAAGQPKLGRVCVLFLGLSGHGSAVGENAEEGERGVSSDPASDDHSSFFCSSGVSTSSSSGDSDREDASHYEKRVIRLVKRCRCKSYTFKTWRTVDVFINMTTLSTSCLQTKMFPATLMAFVLFILIYFLK